jgi:hypothetical protein
MRHRVQARVHEKVRLEDIAQIIAPESALPPLKFIGAPGNRKGQKHRCD